jgi:exopolyphosphatase/guanosine-5'-triphosphate,3'-diphosphate pyrophosphatase
MSDPRYASLDVGSNTVRLLIVERVGEEKIRPLRMERRITRLGGGFSRTKGLDASAMNRTIKALRSFSCILHAYQVQSVFAVATGVLREAKNRSSFLQAVSSRTGLTLRLLNGEEEARLMLRGVLGSLKEVKPGLLVVDIGGWSTEIIWTEKGIPRQTASVRLGTVALCEKFLKKDPPDGMELKNLGQKVGEVLRAVVQEWKGKGWGKKRSRGALVGTAGTITTLAAIDLGLSIYEPEKITGHCIARTQLAHILHHLASLPASERRRIPGLEMGREDLILSGTVVVLKMLEAFGLREMMVVDSGLLEGVLMDGISRLQKGKTKGPAKG